MSENDKLLKPYINQLYRALINKNSGFEEKRCKAVAYAIINTVYDSNHENCMTLLDSGFDVDLAVYGFDELDGVEFIVEADIYLAKKNVAVPEDFLRDFDGDAGATLLQIAESLYREAFKNN